MASAELPELVLPDSDAWREWLAAHHEGPAGVWLVLAKSGTTDPTTLTDDSALTEALCQGWIDGPAKRRDEATHPVQLTPRRARSQWSARNVGIVTVLMTQGRMQPSGMAQVAQAKADGRWQMGQCLRWPATIEVPADLAEALAAAPAARAMFHILTRRPRFAVLYRVDSAQRADTRARRIEKFVAMIRRSAASSVLHGGERAPGSVAVSRTSHPGRFDSTPIARTNEGWLKLTRRQCRALRGTGRDMSDRQTTPSPGIDLPGDETVQATQVIRTTDATQIILTQDNSDTTNMRYATEVTDATAVNDVTDTTDSTDSTDSTPRAAVPAATQARATGQRPRTKAQSNAGRPWFKKMRFALPSAVVAVFAVFAVIIVTTGGHDSGLFRAVTNASQPATEAGLTTPRAPAALGQSVRDGKLAFMVTAIQRPVKSFTDRSGATQSAQGVFVVVLVNVTNNGYGSRSLDATNLFLIDSAGRRFATSSAISSMPGAERVLLQKINPGQTVNNAPVLFDLAPGTVAANIELHDSMTSTGVQVKLP